MNGVAGLIIDKSQMIWWINSSCYIMCFVHSQLPWYAPPITPTCSLDTLVSLLYPFPVSGGRWTDPSLCDRLAHIHRSLQHFVKSVFFLLEATPCNMEHASPVLTNVPGKTTPSSLAVLSSFSLVFLWIALHDWHVSWPPKCSPTSKNTCKYTHRAFNVLCAESVTRVYSSIAINLYRCTSRRMEQLLLGGQGPWGSSL